MPRRSSWKILRPEEQLIEALRKVDQLSDVLGLYTRIQGVRLEARLVGGERRLYAVVDDPTASNDGASYQLAP